MNLDNLRSRLEHHYDASYASFHSKLVPETRYPIHGVRIPILRKIAKEISEAPDLDQALEAQRASFAREVPTFEEVMVHLLTIAYRRDTPDEMHRRAQPSFSLIDNWAHCDTFSVTYAKNLFRDARGIEIIHALICTHDLWTVRAGLVMTLSLKDEQRADFLDFLVTHAADIDDSAVPVSMGLAWVLSQYIATHPDQTQALLNAWPFREDTLRRTYQKIRESRRSVSPRL